MNPTMDDARTTVDSRWVQGTRVSRELAAPPLHTVSDWYIHHPRSCITSTKECTNVSCPTVSVRVALALKDVFV